MGTLKYKNGDVYKGEFHNDKRHGNGVLKNGDKVLEEGFYVDDVKVPDGELTG